MAFSTYQVLKSPKVYFQGLFRSPEDEAKSNSFFLIVIIVVIYSSILYVIGLDTSVIEGCTLVIVGLVFLWKAYEVFKNPKKYFTGLFKRYGDAGRTSVEPLSLLAMSSVVLASYFLTP